MKKIAIIMTNKLLAQSLEAALKTMPNRNFEFYLLLDLNQALLDAEIFEINVALVDMALFEGTEQDKEENKRALIFCEELYKCITNCHILLLVSQFDIENRKIAIEAKKKKIVDDFVFYDVSLKYLFAKLTAF